VVPTLFPEGVTAWVGVGCGVTGAMTVGSAKLKVNFPMSGTSFSAKSE
jgi:hypothetical protein